MTQPAIYLPKAFANTDEAAKRIIAEHPFATVISVHQGNIYATQIPLLLSGKDTLIGHMARANPHAGALLDDAHGTVVTLQFTGANGYVSPAWYTVNSGVPTWNYETVQVRGTLNCLAGAEATESVVKSLIDAFDSQPALVKQAWSDSPASAQAAQLAAIVAFEIKIERCHAKTKLSQNRGVENCKRVIAALSAGNESAKQLAKAMQQAMPSDK